MQIYGKKQQRNQTSNKIEKDSTIRGKTWIQEYMESKIHLFGKTVNQPMPYATCMSACSCLLYSAPAQHGPTDDVILGNWLKKIHFFLYHWIQTYAHWNKISSIIRLDRARNMILHQFDFDNHNITDKFLYMYVFFFITSITSNVFTDLLQSAFLYAFAYQVIFYAAN